MDTNRPTRPVLVLQEQHTDFVAWHDPGVADVDDLDDTDIMEIGRWVMDAVASMNRRCMESSTSHPEILIQVPYLNDREISFLWSASAHEELKELIRDVEQSGNS